MIVALLSGNRRPCPSKQSMRASVLALSLCEPLFLQHSLVLPLAGQQLSRYVMEKTSAWDSDLPNSCSSLVSLAGLTLRNFSAPLQDSVTGLRHGDRQSTTLHETMTVTSICRPSLQRGHYLRSFPDYGVSISPVGGHQRSHDSSGQRDTDSRLHHAAL